MGSGDSKAGQISAPKIFMKAVKRWLQSQFDGKWVDMGNSLPIGIQYDGNSCALCAINAIAHAIFIIHCGYKKKQESSRQSDLRLW